MKLSLLVAGLLLATTAQASEGRAPTRRFALIAGTNDGGPSRVRLRYAASDAQAFARVLAQLGGVRQGDSLVLAEPTRADLLGAFARLEERLAAARAETAQVELLVYYSGHSDETGLLLGGERVGYAELRKALERLPADVRVAILDSCSSGAMIRAKGGKWRPPFLVDESREVRGHAFLTAASAEEAAQESDGIRASYFTHALVSGLRGAADSSRDGRVTLHEAYQFAFDETLARTERTRAGPQHPAYDIQLAGTGDLVLTDLRGSSALLVLAAELEGRLSLRDEAGHLVAELRKVRGYAMELGLEPGTYGATLESDGALWKARFELAEGKRVALDPRQLESVKAEVATSRGDTPTASYRVVPAGVSLVPPLSTNAGEGPVINYIALSLLGGHAARLHGVELGLGVNTESEAMFGFQAAGVANVVLDDAHGAQLASVANYAAEVRGLQAAGAVNIAHSEVLGAQFSGAVNIADRMAGLQAGPLNLAGEIRGVQLGVVNIARSVSMPIGVINVADDADAPLGLVNVIKNGYMRAAAWSSDLALANAGLKMGGRYLYTLIGFGLRPQDRELRYTATGGLGWHMASGPLFLDLEVTGTGLYSRDTFFQSRQVVGSLRAIGGWQILPRLALIAGPTFNVYIGRDGTDLDIAQGPQTVITQGDVTVRMFPGLMLGLQI